MKTARLRQNNLAGPAGYVSMEDGAVGGFVQRGVAAADGERAVVEMGGTAPRTKARARPKRRCAASGSATAAHMGV